MTIQRFSAFTALCAATTIGVAQPAIAEPVTWEIDPEHTVVAFTVMHIDFAKVLGRFSEIEGRFVYDPETRELGEVRVEIGAQASTRITRRVTVMCAARISFTQANIR